MPRLALLGATGALGRSLAALLSERDEPFRAVSRSHMGLQVRLAHHPQAEPFVWDPEDLASITRALEGVHTAVYLAGVAVWEFTKHLALTQSVLAAARQAGVQRLLLVSQNWAYGLPQSPLLHMGRIPTSHPLAATTALGQVRAQQESLLLSAHSPTLSTAVLRCAEFYGPWVEASTLWSPFRAARSTVLGKPATAQLLPPIDTPHEWVFVPDAAHTVLQMLDSPDPGLWGAASHLAGPEPATVRTLSELIFAEAGVAPARYSTPAPWRLRLVRWMNPYIRDMAPMQYLLDEPVLLDDSALAQALGGLRKTPYAEGIRATLPTVRVGR